MFFGFYGRVFRARIYAVKGYRRKLVVGSDCIYSR